MGPASPWQGDGLMDHSELRAPGISSPSFCPLGDAIRRWACRAPRVGPGGRREAQLSSCDCAPGSSCTGTFPRPAAQQEQMCSVHEGQRVPQSDASRLHSGPLPRGRQRSWEVSLGPDRHIGLHLSLLAVSFRHLSSCSQGSPLRGRSRPAG